MVDVKFNSCALYCAILYENTGKLEILCTKTMIAVQYIKLAHIRLVQHGWTYTIKENADMLKPGQLTLLRNGLFKGVGRVPFAFVFIFYCIKVIRSNAKNICIQFNLLA